MNALNRHIEAGERLVISRDVMKPEFQELENRIFIAESGFGMETFTSGSHISGHFEIDGESTNIRGIEISVEETNEVQRYKRETPLKKLVDLIVDEKVSEHERNNAQAMSDSIKEWGWNDEIAVSNELRDMDES